MDDSDLILHEAEAEGYSVLSRLRPGDRYFDKLLKRLDGTKGTWVTIDHLQGDGSEHTLGVRHKDRTCLVHGVTEDGRKTITRRHAFNLYLSELVHPESIAELQERHGAPPQGMW